MAKRDEDMKVLLITWGCDRNDISESVVTYDWVKQISLDHDVTVFSVSLPDRFGCVTQQFPELNVIEWQDIRVPKFLHRFRSIVKPAYLPYFFKARFFLKKLIKREKFDVIHHISPIAFRYPTVAYGLGVPVVRGPVAGGLPTPKGLENTVNDTFHPYKFLRHTDNLRKKIDPVLRKAYGTVDTVILAAPYVREILRPLPIKHYEVEVEHGIEQACTPIPAKQKSDSDVLTFLYVGRIVRTKGLRDAIRAFKKISTEKAIKFTIVGDGEDLAKCKNEALDLPPNVAIEFVGWKLREELPQFYQDADVFIFPSYREPSGGVMLEALSNSLPCITCDYGGPGYLVTENCGVLVKPQREGEFADAIALAIDDLSENCGKREMLAENAGKRANELFLWSEKRKRISQIYNKITMKGNQ